MNRRESIDALPFRAWLADQIDQAARATDDPVAHLARRLLPHKTEQAGVRQINRWKNGVRASSRDGVKADFPTDDFPIADVEEALFNADLRLEDLYPEFADQAVRVELVSARPDLDARERCACGRRKTARALTCDTCAFQRRDDTGRLARTVPETARVCTSCGGPKSYAADSCWACYLAAGGHRGRRHRSRPAKCTEQVVLEAYELYQAGLSLRKVAAEIHPRTTYASVKSCANALHDQFTRRGWPLRDRVEASRDATVVHGSGDDKAAAKRWRRRQAGMRPPCAGVRTQYPRKGAPCQRPAQVGSDFCIAHDPARAAEREQRLIDARATLTTTETA